MPKIYGFKLFTMVLRLTIGTQFLVDWALQGGPVATSGLETGTTGGLLTGKTEGIHTETTGVY